MKRKKQKNFTKAFFYSKINNESGVALVIALLIMVLLTILGTAAIMTSTTDVKIAANFKKSTNAFYAAEAGIEAGMDFLNSPGIFDATTGWNLFLGNNVPLGTTNTEVTTGANAFYTISAKDDEPTVLSWVTDEDGNTATDNNLKIIITSVGTYSSSTVTLEAYIQYDRGYDSYGGKDLTSGNTNVASGKATWG